MTRKETLHKLRWWLDSFAVYGNAENEYYDILASAIYYLGCSDGHTISDLKAKETYLLSQRRSLKKRLKNLRKNFIAYVSSGSSSPAPYCYSACKHCVDADGCCVWSSCTGFDPKEESSRQ